MHILNFYIHGNSLQFSTNTSAIAESAKFLLRYFPVNSIKGAAGLSLSLHGVPLPSDIPLALSAEAICLSAPKNQARIDVHNAVYQDQGRLIFDSRSSGYLFVIDQHLGHVEGYIVDPENVPSELRMNLIHLALQNILKRKGYFTLHATSLEKNGRAVLIPGNSGRGKTTAFLSLLRSGYRCLSDDHPLVHENGNGLNIYSFPEKVDVTEDSIEFFPELRSAREYIHPGMRKPYFLIENVYSEGLATSCKPGLIIFPQVMDRPTSVLERVSGTQALDSLIRESFLPRGNDIAKQEFHLLSKLVKQSSCYRLLFGQDVLDLPRLIDPLMERW
ncbi:hypothetical protein [Candidatus Nitronereus thalassa]|uniref:HPr kinase/phosphorylase n=1 Tax=Candidatus Nitronereus thalassa TaxID=3020898 RepID=A0ABU3K589_9BACT|nr:hypothetical protein [Candidatus Nitronereus thalassa]MDT7041592.1 hypothetical protein [Candidatus Nitronereus thalassa]